MRILQITDQTKEDIQKLIAYAKAHIVSNDRLKAMVQSPKEFYPAGDDADHVVHIHDGYRVVYSIEEQNIGLCSHISISVESRTKYSHEAAVALILKEFGMSLDLATKIWLEKTVNAVNVLQLIDGGIDDDNNGEK